MGLIKLEGIRVFAYHGHLPEEAKLGGNFIVNVWVTVDTFEVEKTDIFNSLAFFCRPKFCKKKHFFHVLLKI